MEQELKKFISNMKRRQRPRNGADAVSAGASKRLNDGNRGHGGRVRQYLGAEDAAVSGSDSGPDRSKSVGK